MKLVTSGGPVPMILALLLATTMSSGSKTPSEPEKQSVKVVDLEAKKAENLKRFERLDNRRYSVSPLQARGRGGKSHRRSPSIESEGTPDALPMSLEKAIEEIAGSGTASPMISDTSISPSRSDATPPPYGEIFHFELEEKGPTDLAISMHSRSSDTEEAPNSPMPLSAAKKKNESQAQSLPIDIPKRDLPSPGTEKATQSQSTGSDIYLDRARLSRELERVRSKTEHKFHTK